MCALFSLEILRAVAVKGLKERKKGEKKRRKKQKRKQRRRKRDERKTLPLCLDVCNLSLQGAAMLVRSLSAKKRKRLARDLFATFATYVGLDYDVTEYTDWGCDLPLISSR